MKYEIKPNAEFNSLEISFEGKPSEDVREALKGLRYRWHGMKKVWYGYSTEEAVREAIDNAESGKAPAKTSKAPKKAEKPEKKNKFGIKVGDIFYSSWGYEQTNVDFFQVVELVGECSARIREVVPNVVKQDSYGPMSSNNTYRINSATILPKKSYSVHIKDNDKGDLKRIKKSGETVYFNMASYANAYLLADGDHEMYESWYA